MDEIAPKHDTIIAELPRMVMVISATYHANVFDSALRRFGRFGRFDSEMRVPDTDDFRMSASCSLSGDIVADLLREHDDAATDEAADTEAEAKPEIGQEDGDAGEDMEKAFDEPNKDRSTHSATSKGR